MEGKIFTVLSVQLLARIYSQLCFLQIQNDVISFEDIVEVIGMTSPTIIRLNSEDIRSYSGIIYEAILKPDYSDLRGAKLRIKEEIVENEDLYFNAIVNTLQKRKNYSFISNPNTDKLFAEFIGGCEDYLNHLRNSKRSQTRFDSQSGFRQQNPNNHEIHSCDGANLRSAETTVPPNQAVKPQRNQSSKADGMVRILAYIRKGGMDVLFPQAVHDKILVIVYTAVKCISPIVHRILMDMVVAVKEMNVVTGLDSISKTKIRGVFALLKTCNSLGTINGEGESVQVFIDDGINSFKEFKERHDTFFSQCLSRLHISLSSEEKSELIWSRNNHDAVTKKLAALKEIETTVEHFFRYGKINPASYCEPPPAPPLVFAKEDNHVNFYPDYSRWFRPTHPSTNETRPPGDGAVLNRNSTITNHLYYTSTYASSANNASEGLRFSEQREQLFGGFQSHQSLPTPPFLPPFSNPSPSSTSSDLTNKLNNYKF